MPDTEITPREAIIILDRLNTVGRIDVDREQLRAAVRTAKAALNKQIGQKPVAELTADNELSARCPCCDCELTYIIDFCSNCGQALDWTN